MVRVGFDGLPTDGMLHPQGHRLPGNRNNVRRCSLTHYQEKALYRDGGLPDELAGQRARGRQAAQEGYELTDDIKQADAILYNTCSVRQHAEDKIYSALGRIKRIKENKPEVAIGVLGCMAQKDQEDIFRRAPHVDIVVGPGQLARVPELLATAQETKVRQDWR